MRPSVPLTDAAAATVSTTPCHKRRPPAVPCRLPCCLPAPLPACLRQVVVEMVQNKLAEDDVQQNGWLLDGYPRRCRGLTAVLC